jgi:hypothetical protein
VLIERKIIVMKLNSVLLAGLVSMGLLTIGADSASARGYFSAGNPGGLRTSSLPGGLAASGYRLAHTPANQAWETNNAWANYKAQNGQVQVPNVSTGNSGSALQHNAVTR